MEFQFLAHKFLRKISLYCGIPKIKESYVRRRTITSLAPFHFDMELAKTCFSEVLNTELLVEIKNRAEGVKDGNLYAFCEPPVKRVPGVFLSHPKTGRREPLVSWNRARIKNTGYEQDIKFLWEINRLGDLDPLLFLAIVEKKKSYIHTACDIVLQWYKENPSGLGINWFSNMEVALRLLRLLFLKGVMDSFSLNTNVVNNIIFEHAVHVAADWKVSRRTMKGGNHLLVEVAALAVFETLSDMPGAGRIELQKEMSRQFHDDGGYFEGSSGYHAYVVNVLIFSHFLCLAAGKASPVTQDILENAIGLLEKISGPNGYIPRIGDWDEGHVFAPVLSFPARLMIDLSLAETVLSMKKHDNSSCQICVFPQSQMAGWRTPQRDLVVFRAANVEHGHSHLDMLSLHFLGKNGPVIMDGGTFQYNHSRKKRNQYRGINAHSTIVADGFWPVRPLRNFAWKSGLTVSFESGPDWVKGCYQSGKNVSVQRTVTFQEMSLLVCDECSGALNFWAQFIVPDAEIIESKIFIYDNEKEHILTFVLQRGIIPKISKTFISECYGIEKQACAVCLPIIDILETRIIWEKTTPVQLDNQDKGYTIQC